MFEGYTTKQWGLPPEMLDATVTARVPIRISEDDRYFQDTYQALPVNGYTELFRRLLDHPNITMSLGTDYESVAQSESHRRLIYTGPIDSFYDHVFGALPYRSIEFTAELIDSEFHLPTGTVNFPNSHAYTRTTEMKRLTGQVHPKSVIVYEFPMSDGDPYYPVPRRENAELYQKYRNHSFLDERVIFSGRLADYRYYNMDQAVARALSVFETEIV